MVQDYFICIILSSLPLIPIFSKWLSCQLHSITRNRSRHVLSELLLLLIIKKVLLRKYFIVIVIVILCVIVITVFMRVGTVACMICIGL